MGNNDGSFDAYPESLFEQMLAQEDAQLEAKAHVPESEKIVKTNDMIGDIVGTVPNRTPNAPPSVMPFSVNQLNVQDMANVNSDINMRNFMTNPDVMQQAANAFINNPTLTQDGTMDTFVKDSGNINAEQFVPKEVEDLVMLGRLEREIDFHGNRLVMTTLNGMDNINIIDEVSKFGTPETKRASGVISTLVRSIKVFNGNKFYAENPGELSYSNFQNITQAKHWLLGFQQTVINELYGEYAKLLKEQQALLGQVKK